MCMANKGPWNNTSIYLKLHGSMCGDFISHEITDRYNLMCSLVAHDKIKPRYENYEISIGDRSIPKKRNNKIIKSIRCYS